MAIKRNEKYIPKEVHDILLHLKENEGVSEAIILPYTRYDNVLNRPRVISSVDDGVNGAPFNLYAVAHETVSDTYLSSLYQRIYNS